MVGPSMRTRSTSPWAYFEVSAKGWKMVCFQAESLPGEHVLATYSHSIFRPVVPVKELFERLLKVGVTQHYAIVDGDWRAELAAFAEIMGFEFYDIR